MAVAAWKDEIPPPQKHDPSTALERADIFERDRQEWLAQEVDKTFPDLRPALTDHGWNLLLDELARAPTPEATSRVLQGWYYTMLARANPAYWEGVAKAGTGRIYTSEELKKALGL